MVRMLTRTRMWTRQACTVRATRRTQTLSKLAETLSGRENKRRKHMTAWALPAL